MTVYFEAKTNSGVLQVRDDTAISYLSNKAKLSDYYVTSQSCKYQIDGGSNTSHTMYVYRLPTDIVAYIGNPSSNAVHIFTTINNVTDFNNQKGLGLYKLVGVSNCTKAQADNLNVYMFKQDAVGGTGTVGLQCFNASGVKVFDSNSNYLKVMDVVNFQHCAYGNWYNVEYSDNWKKIDKTHNHSKHAIAYWCSMFGSGGQWNRNTSGDNNWWVHDQYSEVCILSASSARVATLKHTEFPVGGSVNYNFCLLCGANSNRTMYSIIDVTNY